MSFLPYTVLVSLDERELHRAINKAKIANPMTRDLRWNHPAGAEGEECSKNSGGLMDTTWVYSNATGVSRNRLNAQGQIVAVTGATNANPIVVTTGTAHGLNVGDKVAIWSVGGNTNANGTWIVTVVGSTTTFTIGAAGNANYTSGGSASPQIDGGACRFSTDATGGRLLRVAEGITIGQSFTAGTGTNAFATGGTEIYRTALQSGKKFGFIARARIPTVMSDVAHGCVGLIDAVGNAITGANANMFCGINAAQSTSFFTARGSVSGGATTSLTSTVAVDKIFHTFAFFQDTGSYYFAVDGETYQTAAFTNLGVKVHPGLFLGNQGAGHSPIICSLDVSRALYFWEMD